MAGEKILQLADKLASESGRANLVALQTLNGLMQRRIFANGKATDNSDIGQYISNWKNRRAQNNLQTGYVDLRFNGDLQRSMQVAQRDNVAELGFTLAKYRLIAEGNEKQRNKEIFSPSDEELEAMIDAYTREIEAIIKSI